MLITAKVDVGADGGVFHDLMTYTTRSMLSTLERQAPAATGAQGGVVKRKKTTTKPRKRQDSYHIDKVGTFTFWEKPEEGMSGGSFTPPKKRGTETREILEKGAKLVAQGSPDWPVALLYKPKLPPKVARERYRILKSKRRALFDALVDKYRNEYVTD